MLKSMIFWSQEVIIQEVLQGLDTLLTTKEVTRVITEKVGMTEQGGETISGTRISVQELTS